MKVSNDLHVTESNSHFSVLILLNPSLLLLSHHIFIKHLVCSRYCFRSWEYSNNPPPPDTHTKLHALVGHTF